MIIPSVYIPKNIPSGYIPSVYIARNTSMFLVCIFLVCIFLVVYEYS